MKTYIAFLRGINVGGHKKIKMADLREAITDLDYGNIKTYIQSGNIIFQTRETNTDKLAQQIEDKIKEAYNFEVKTFVKTPKQIQKMLDQNPIEETDQKPPNRIFVIPINEAPAPHLAKAVKEIDIGKEELVIKGDVIYFSYPLSVSRPKTQYQFFGKETQSQRYRKEYPNAQKNIRYVR